MKILLTIFCLFFLKSFIIAQSVCTTPGQNPSTAFPVCGTSTFTQSSVPLCGGRQVPSPTCRSYPLTDINPFWYKFTCFQSGTLGFKITPHDNTEDYDWQLFDVTAQNINAVYTDVSLVVASNWSGESGTTGASSAGSCYIAVPTAFTPNGDGRNDYLYPLNAIKAEKLEFRIYNRWGQLIFQTNNWKTGWDGTFKGIPQATGVYVWFLNYVDRDTKQLRQMKGTTALIR